VPRALTQPDTAARVLCTVDVLVLMPVLPPSASKRRTGLDSFKVNALGYKGGVIRKYTHSLSDRLHHSKIEMFQYSKWRSDHSRC
jgi:hypothetical protein